MVGSNRAIPLAASELKFFRESMWSVRREQGRGKFLKVLKVQK